MNWRELWQSRPLRYGALAAAGLGAVVLLRRTMATRSVPSGTAGDGRSSGGSVAGGYLGRVDTTGTDVASWLGNYSGSLQTQLDQYQQQLTDSLTALRNAPPTTGPPAATPSPAGSVPPATAAARYVTVTRFSSPGPAWSSTLSGIAGHEGTTVASLLRLNPAITNPNLIRTGAAIRVR